MIITILGLPRLALRTARVSGEVRRRKIRQAVSFFGSFPRLESVSIGFSFGASILSGACGFLMSLLFTGGAPKMAIAILQALGSFTAAAVAWLTLEFLGRPIRKFFDLRAEIISTMAQTENVRAQFKEVRGRPDQVERLEITGDERRRLEDAQRVIRGLASSMRAFAVNETLAGWAIKKMGYNPRAASDALFGYSNKMDTYGFEQHAFRQQLYAALKLRDV